MNSGLSSGDLQCLQLEQKHDIFPFESLLTYTNCDDSLKSFENEKPYSDIAIYVPNHKDKIILSFGEGNISEQLEYLVPSNL